LDPRRAPLQGDEIRPCWEERDAPLVAPLGGLFELIPSEPVG
jgi:hypothetical protein